MKEALLDFLLRYANRAVHHLLWLKTERNLRSLGSGTVIHPTVIIKSPHKLVLGKNCTISEYVILDAKSRSEVGISIGDYVVIKPKAYISTNGGQIVLEDYVGIGHNAWLGGQSTIRIGPNSLIGMHTVIVSSNHDYRKIVLPYYGGEEILAPIGIGENVWIGANCVILPGVSIGDNSVIGAGSVVRGDIPAHCVAFGVPATVQMHFGDTVE